MSLSNSPFNFSLDSFYHTESITANAGDTSVPSTSDLDLSVGAKSNTLSTLSTVANEITRANNNRFNHVRKHNPLYCLNSNHIPKTHLEIKNKIAKNVNAKDAMIVTPDGYIQMDQYSYDTLKPQHSAGGLKRMKADTFCVTPEGGIFKSSSDPNIKLYFPVNAVSEPLKITLQVSLHR